MCKLHVIGRVGFYPEYNKDRKLQVDREYKSENRDQQNLTHLESQFDRVNLFLSVKSNVYIM